MTQLEQYVGEKQQTVYSDFVSVLAFDLRNIFAPIRGYINLLQHYTLPSERTSKIYATLENQMIFAKQKLDELQYKSRLILGTLTLNCVLKTIQLAELEELLWQTRCFQTTPHPTYQIHITPDLPPFYLDWALLHPALSVMLHELERQQGNPQINWTITAENDIAHWQLALTDLTWRVYHHDRTTLHFDSYAGLSSFVFLRRVIELHHGQVQLEGVERHRYLEVTALHFTIPLAKGEAT
jgi:light-regulated signal transduction histidine kinase (bacteriophytochrome)